MPRFGQPMRSAISHFGDRIGGSTLPALSTTDLIARYDANDIANHDAASGLLSPSAGTATIDLQFKNAGVAAAFTYATNQNGYRVISVPASRAFVPVSNSGATVTEILSVFAYRLNTFSQGFINTFVKASDGSRVGLYFDTTGQTLLNSETIGSAATLVLTGLNTGDGAFRIMGLIYDASTLGFLQSSRATDVLTQASMASYSSAVYPLHTDASFAETGDVDFCELLIYNNPSPGTVFDAMNYLKQKWNP